MSKAKKIVRIVFGSLLALFCLGLLGAYLYFSNLPPAGELLFMAPGEPAVILVDGERIELSAKGQRHVELPAGEHEVVVESPMELESAQIEVLDRKTLIVPVVVPQCYVVFDVTQSAYDVGTKAQPRFVRAMKQEGPFELPYAHYTTLDSLPAERSSGQSVMLLVTSSCEEVGEIAARHSLSP